MKSVIFFLRHGQLEKPYQDHLTMDFEALVKLSCGELNPGLGNNATALFLKNARKIPFSKIELIIFNNYRGQFRRCQESARIIANIVKKRFNKKILCIGNSDLKEIRFDVSKLVTKENYKKRGMPAIREALFAAMINNEKSVESFKRTYQRAALVFDYLKRFEQKNKKIILVTHDFFMRVIELFIKNKGKKRKFTVKDLENTNFNDYFSGFGTSYSLDFFEKIS